MRYLWANKQQQVVLNTDTSSLINSFCYHKRSIYAIQDGQLIAFNCKDGSKINVDDSIEFTKVQSSYGQMFTVSRAGQLFAFNDNLATFVPLDLLANGPKCKHGTQLQHQLKVTQVCSNEISTIFTDDSYKLWSFQNDKIWKNETIYATRIELNSCAYSVRQFVTGRRHCAVLIDFVNTNQGDVKLDQTLTDCEKCKEDANFQLSSLMKSADDQFEENLAAETKSVNLNLVKTSSTSRPVKSLPERSRLGFNQIFSSIRSPFSKTSTPNSKFASTSNSEWYAIPTKETKASSLNDRPETSDIELTTLSSERPNFATSVDLSGLIAFSFVSLDNLLSSGSDDSSVSHNDELLNQLFDQTATDRLHSFVSDQVANTFCEVWCFGANNFGQLGIGNTIPTRTPKKAKLPQCPVLKLSSGDNFTVALLATGEVYGWGNNENGQLKLENNHLVEPTIIKLGSKLCAIDVSAFGNAAFVAALSTENLNVVVCRFSKADSEDANQGITRLCCLEKSCIPMHIDAFEDSLLVGHLPFSDDNKAKIQDALKDVSKFLFSARTNLQLAHLAQSIKNKVERRTLFALSSALWRWASIVSQLAEHLRTVFFIDGSLKFKNTKASNLTFDVLMQNLLKLHYSCLDAIADSAFNDLNLSSKMQKSLEQLFYEFNTESSKEFKRVRALFCGVPKREFFKLIPVTSRILGVKQPSTFWRKLENEFELAEKWAKLTAKNAKLRPANLPISVLLAGFFEEPYFHVRSRSTSTSIAMRHFLGKQKNVLLIWTDSLNIIQNDSILRLEFALLKVDKNAENPLFYCISDPEIKIEIGFEDTEKATHFVELLNQAWNYSKNRSQFFQNKSGSSSPSAPMFESRMRHAKYTFSAFHTVHANATYEGAWLDNKPHGRGKLIYPDGRQYTGKFVNGLFHGFGELLTGASEGALSTSSNSSLRMTSIFYSQPKNLLDTCHTLKGCFKDGQLNGLGTAYFLNGDKYEGYFRNNQMHGHGVYQTPLSTYVGSFRNSLRHGYGVLSSNNNRYMGEFADSKKHGLGTIITIDGVYHEGLFENDKFVNGKAVYETPDLLNLTAVVSYEGAFSDLGVASGKGTLCLNKHDKIVGTFHGNIFDLTITNANYIHNTETSTLNSEFLMTNEPKHCRWTVHEDKKWTELFAHFVEDVFKIDESKFQKILEDDSSIGVELSKSAWEHLASYLAKTKHRKSATFDDRLERIPNCKIQPFTASYYAMVTEYWTLAIESEGHPLNRLLHGVAELFHCSYASVGTHVVIYDDSVVLEFRSLLYRCYIIARILFINLPPAQEMYSLVPTAADYHHDTSSEASSSSAETISIGSLEDAMLKMSSTSEVAPRLRVTDNARSNLLATPSCDFLIDYFFNECYADLFTLYSEKTQAADNQYWSRIMHLSSYNDVVLLRYFDVKNELWPMNFESTRELDTFTVRVSAKNKLYGSAVTKLQELSAAINPTNKLAILAETFYEITACTSKFSTVGPSHTWSVDELLPAFIYVVVRAQVQHLGAEIRLLYDFSPHVSTESSSEIALMFTIFQSAYYSICLERGNP